MEQRHGDGGHGMAMATNATHEPLPASYFYQPGYPALLWSHISLSVLAWCFALPIAVFLSIGRSRYTFLGHVVFSTLNAIALVLGIVYNAKTPDLYENNLHHKIGWIFSIIAAAQSVMALIRTHAPKVNAVRPAFTFPKVQYKPAHGYSWSRDSGVGSSEGDASPRQSLPGSPGFEEAPLEMHRYDHGSELEGVHEDEAGNPGEESHSLLSSGKWDSAVRPYVRAVANSRAMRAIGLIYATIDRLILILGFVLILTGIVTYGGLFKGITIFSGLAHFIKGGIFFWYGLLTLGRVMGSFGDLGWAWNMKPTAEMVGRRKANAPSTEFVESFIIFFYGSTNVFLEHLASEPGVWSSTDLEHISIAIMFFGSGLCGMLVESKKIRNILNSTVTSATGSHGLATHTSAFEEPKSYGYSLNPMPAITIMLLGIMMSSHHQESMVSTMLHSQWGTLFVAAALARGVTYILIYLKPPTSYLPSRPPSEIVVAFCLISGGMIFMSSNKGMVEGMENLNLNAMFMFTVLMGLTAFIMAWEVVVLMIKGLAVQREQRSAKRTLSSASTQA